MKNKIKPASPALVLNAISDMMVAAKECAQFEQAEITKRTYSNNQKEVAIEAIRAKRDVLLAALEMDHQLNKEKIDKSFDVINKAMETGDLKMLELGLGSMLKVAETSSLVQLQKLVQDESNIIDI